ncbi:MAG TPA: DinB family protein [Pseudomonadales bacterium]|nr:DinB family protein [Pseudomonadales bacterium]
MDLKDYAVAMAHYNRWMNEKIYACCEQLTEAQLKEDRGAFFKSILGTLNHLYLIDEAWLQRFRGEPVTMKSTRDIAYENFAELKVARAKMDELILAFAEGITPEFSASILSMFSISYQKHMQLPMYAAVLQLFNHQTHHRGQVTTLLMQFGVDPGVTDLPMLPYFNVFG